MADPNVNDQKPVLSPEEELNVLEAAYKIGKERGLDLLRPEQVKRLVDAGRVVVEDRFASLTYQNEEEAVETAYRIVRGTLETMDKFKDDYYSAGVWDSYSKSEREFAREQIFRSTYGMTSKELGFQIFLNIFQG